MQAVTNICTALSIPNLYFPPFFYFLFYNVLGTAWLDHLLVLKIYFIIIILNSVYVYVNVYVGLNYKCLL